MWNCWASDPWRGSSQNQIKSPGEHHAWAASTNTPPWQQGFPASWRQELSPFPKWIGEGLEPGGEVAHMPPAASSLSCGQIFSGSA